MFEREFSAYILVELFIMYFDDLFCNLFLKIKFNQSPSNYQIIQQDENYDIQTDIHQNMNKPQRQQHQQKEKNLE